MQPVSSSAPARPLRIVIVGAGFSGIAMALALQRAGRAEEMLIVDKAEDFGGTWRDNTYPGCECDIPSPVYSLRGEPYDWSRFYGGQQEILTYIHHVVDKHGLRRHARFGTEITTQVWDEDQACWMLHTADGGTIAADVVVNGVGPLTEAVIPDIPGKDAFAGPAFHSAHWRHDVDLAGLRVGVIGTGASAIQIVPSIVDTVGAMTVFQRTPSWVIPKVERTYSAPERFLLRNAPALQWLLRQGTLQILERGVWRAMARDQRAEGLIRRLGELNIRRGLSDPETQRKVTPQLTPGCKRLMFSNDYYPALDHDHVTVETTGIEAINATGVRLVDGTQVDVDVIIWGTGFDVHHFWQPMTVIGQDGQALDDVWRDAATAHNSIATPGFPNNFFLLGPNSGTGHNSVILMAEAQVDYIMQGLEYLWSGAVDWLAPTVEATRAYAEEMARRHEDLVWAAGCKSWYVNAEGVNDSLYPGNVTDYQRRVARFDIEHYESGRRARVGQPVPASA